jgi:FkbM family methyltransferase
MKNVFLDLGTHYGQGLREFIASYEMDETWTIHTFEANPVTYEIFVRDWHKETPWVIHHNMAVSDHDGTITVNLETPPNEGDTGMGSSVISLDKWNPWGLRDRNHFQNQREVHCFSLSKFIRENFSKEDNIVIKMDIEGSEYDTLEKMIEEGTIEYVNSLTTEWHARFFTNKEEIELREQNLLNKLQTYDGLKLESWR